MSSNAQAVNTCLDEISGKIQRFMDAVQWALDCVPDFLRFLIDRAIKKWNDFVAETKKFFALVADIFSYGWGDADALRAAARKWEDCAASMLEEANELLSNDAIKSDTSWEGEAGEKYAAGFQQQIDALRDGKDIAEALGEMLDKHATALDTFYANLTAGMIGVGASLAGLVVSVIALVPPITPIGVVGIIVSAIGLIVSLYFLFKNEIDDLNRMADNAADAAESIVVPDPWPVFVRV